MSEVIWDATQDELDTAYDIAEETLRRKNAARNSDEFFCWYSRKYIMGDGDDTDLDSYSEFKGGVKIRTLIRKKAEIQNVEDRFPPSDPSVAEKKGIRADVIRDHYSGDHKTLEKFREANFFSEEE